MTLPFNLQWNNSDAFRTLRRNGSTSLCDYLRTTILSMAVFIMMFTLLAGLIVVILLALISILAFWLLPLVEFSFIDYELGRAMTILSPIVLTVVGVLGTLTGEVKIFPDWIKKPFKAVFEHEDESPCNKSLVKELYKAYKDKFCPIVTLKDD